MPVAMAQKIKELSQAADPKAAIINAAGDLSNETVMWDLVLVGTYFRPEKTAGGIIRPMENVQEDAYQGKVGLILKRGPDVGEDLEVGDWVVYSIKDGWAVTINGVPCRLVPYEKIRMRLSAPDKVF